MALALADSIANVGWDIDDQARRYLAWWRRGEYSVNGRCFDIGVQTRAALTPIRYAGLFPGRIEELARLAAESSVPTHPSPQCLSACRYLALILAGLIHGRDRAEVLAPDWRSLEELRAAEPLHPAVEEVASGSFRQRQLPEIVGSGYVIRSLEAALRAFHDAADFRDAVLMAVNLGDDADTTGAVCGQLAGAYWGVEGIPQDWLDQLAREDMINRALDELLSPDRI